MRWLRELTQRPEFTTALLQVTKSVIAATAAWWLSRDVLDSALPFLAPWTALLTVHATVHRSLSRGAQTTVATAIGVVLSFLIGAYLGVGVWTFALALFVALAGARISWIRDEGVAIATTAIFVLGSGFSEQQPLLLDRIIEVAVGVAIGVLVNLLIFPPLRDTQAARYVDSINRRMGEVLVSMAEEFSTSWETDRADAWRSEIESMTAELDTAWRTVRFAQESRRSNPWSRLSRPRRGRGGQPPEQTASYAAILQRVDEGVSHLRHLARTLNEAAYSDGDWDERFRERWAAVVRDAGYAIADPDADVEPIAERLTSLAREMADERGLPRETWPLYGSLLSSMRHIAVIVDDVASAREARETSNSNPQA
ncbi:aromatic acid exporter family protein [Microbacterium sp. LRZ72]|uniref:FUSC family protein n=1 Tax=Microbacterium sp. LRZ72 TaxID=2942481 RepID=UPI0029AC72F4|nr:aromatic acid exporter family protein [Microbacterium sp. LRZ72]MDX2377090.1 aromatic acid exporter family protein [Microbacterium sp. LRZ72]